MSGSALAADMATKAPPIAAPSPAYNWTGFYVGVNLGGTWADNDSTYVGGTVGYPIAPHTVDLQSASVIGGGQIGANWQTGMFVLGAEADIDGRYLNASASGILTPTGSILDQVTQTENWIGTVRGRVGLAQGRALFYATGGLAYGDIEHTYTKTYPAAGLTFGASDSAVGTGWTVGGGIEYAIWNNVTVGVEYLHVDLGTTTLSVATTVAAAAGQATFSDRSDIVRLRVNWLFGVPQGR